MAELMRVPVELPPGDYQSDTPTDLSSRINQIFNQKGPFRNVTEESVLNDPSSDESDNEDNDLRKDETSEDEHDPERLLKERNELLQMITESNIQINSALDFISMVLSQTSQIAKGSFSEGLRQAVVPGMFNTMVLSEGHAEPNVKSLAEISFGSKATSLSKASDNLMAASKRLQNTTEQDSLFWSQVAEVKEKGWRLSRHPRASHVIGVHFGSAESAPQFRARGFAVMRKDENSELFLDRSGSSSRPKRVAVTVFRNDRNVGSFTPSLAASADATDIENQIVNARDSLLDEELFYEIGREARLAANQGIVSRGEDIEFSIDAHTKFRLSLQAPAAAPLRIQGELDAMAMYISFALRSLLVQAHHEHLLRRSLAPAPMSARPPLQPEYALLRPLMAKLKHVLAVMNVRRQIEQVVVQPLSRAGLGVSLELVKEESRAMNSSPDIAESIVSVKPQITRFALKLPTTKSNEVTVRTYLGRPIYGTAYEASEMEYDVAKFHASQYDTPDLLAKALSRLAILDLTSLVIHHDKKRWHSSQPRKGLLSLISNNGKDDAIELRLQFVSDTLVAQIQSSPSRDAKGRLNIAWTDTETTYTGELKDLNIVLKPRLTFEKLLQGLVDSL